MSTSAVDGAGPNPDNGVVLAPRPWVPLGVITLGAACALLNRWAAAGVAVFGLFLLIQSQILRLQFSADALLVWRGNSVLRTFPYSAWLGWKLFWGPIPVLFYFREQQSIHLLPVLFDASSLREQLNRHISAQP